MGRLTLRSLWAHKRRLLSTVAAVVLGVGFMSGILVFSDTMGRLFDDLFAETSEGIDVVVQGPPTINDPFAGDVRANLDPSVLDVVRGVPGVAVAEPAVGMATASTRVLDTEGDAIGTTMGPPTLIESWIDDVELSAYTLTEGSRAPAADDEMALNVAAAEDAGWSIGDTVPLYTQFGTREYELVGTFMFGTAKSSGGAISVEFTLAEAQRLAGNDGFTNILVAAEAGTSPTELATAVQAALPPGVEAITGEAYATQISDSVQQGFAFFTQLLVIFAGIALFVGLFIIYNTFQILVAQRTRELALLRAVGASKNQVLRSVLLEAAVVALIASAAGVGFGLLLAQGVISAFAGSGADLPTTSLLLKPGTLLTCFVIGLVVTLLAALVPAWRATRVPPLAALRDVAVEAARPSTTRIVVGIGLGIGALFLLSAAWREENGEDALASVGMGALFLLVAAIVAGPALAAPTVRLLGAPARLVRGITGSMASENAARSPKRTSATASALLIAVTLIGFITVLAASATESIEGNIDERVNADAMIVAPFGFGPFVGFSPTLAAEVRDLFGDQVVTSEQGVLPVEITYPDGDVGPNFLTSVQPDTITAMADPVMLEGEVGDLTPEGILVDRVTAEGNDLAVGDHLAVTTPGGEILDLTVQGIHDDLIIFNTLVFHHDTFLRVAPEALDVFLWMDFADGVDLDAALVRLEEAAAEVPIVDVVDRDGFAEIGTSAILGFVTFLYVMLALSVLIAVIGIANTLSLSIHERTKEIGLLRAVGALRSQVRSAMRWEAAIIAVLGTLVGLALGLLISYALIKSLGSFGLTTFSVPVGSLAFIVVLGAGLGVLASLLPAARASRLDVLEAISHE